MSGSQALIDPRKLRMKRIRAGLNPPQLAKLAHLHPSHIRFLEQGERGTSPKTLNVLADVFGCDITELMPDEPEPELAAAS
jgi:transcriptional regulator with XRE-family HTH domain